MEIACAFRVLTSARVGDLAMLTWQNIDLERNEVHYTSRKTGRTVIVPFHNGLRSHVEGLPASDAPQQPRHSRAYRIVANEECTGTLSRQFSEIMAAAGLIASRPHAAQCVRNQLSISSLNWERRKAAVTSFPSSSVANIEGEEELSFFPTEFS